MHSGHEYQHHYQILVTFFYTHSNHWLFTRHLDTIVNFFLWNFPMCVFLLTTDLSFKKGFEHKAFKWCSFQMVGEVWFPNDFIDMHLKDINRNIVKAYFYWLVKGTKPWKKLISLSINLIPIEHHTIFSILLSVFF